MGIVQGLTEFLPVSSSGHLSFLQNEFGIDGESADMLFNVILHLGTLIAVIVYYRATIWDVLTHILKRRLTLMLIIATAPLVGIVFLRHYIEFVSSNTVIIGALWLINGALLILSDTYAGAKNRRANGNAESDLTENNSNINVDIKADINADANLKTDDTVRWYDALIVGIAQCAAILPGLSRSGVTITAGTFRGFDRRFAVKFSFLLSIPAILGANLFEINSAVKAGFDTSAIPSYIAGIVAACVSGFLAIKFVDWIAGKVKFKFFGIYCIALGIVAITLALVR